MGKSKVAVVVVAGGRGERAATAGDPTPKQYLPIAGVPLLTRTISAFLSMEEIDLVLPVIRAGDEPRYTALGLAAPRLLPPVKGGDTRQLSSLAGLKALAPEKPDFVLIHDAARPFVSRKVVRSVLDQLDHADAVLPVTTVTDTIKRSADGHTVGGTEDRTQLYAAQTPQGFRFSVILAAHRRAVEMSDRFTDDASIAEWARIEVALAQGDPENIKITMPGDSARAERLLGGNPMETRIGTGFDVHPFELGSAVILGGVAIPHGAKLKGHSDADAGLHALCDALYGALGVSDIGTFFPPSDPQWRGAPSSTFLAHAAGLVREAGGRIVNLDLTLVCEAPRIAPHGAAMRARIAEICGISPARVAIKATTSEKLGFTGREEGIVAMAAASVELPKGNA